MSLSGVLYSNGGVMSIDATRWAWKADLKPASLKLVLLSLADRADEKHTAYPSIKRLTVDTGLDQKTVRESMHKLEEHGVIADTGRRKGRTKQVKVWQLVGVVGRHDEEGTVEVIPNIQGRKQSLPKSGALENERLPKTDALKTPKNGRPKTTENGTLKDSQKRYPESISNNLSVEPPPVVPQGDAVEEKDPPDKPPPFSNEFAYAVLEQFNAVANRPENSRNWCAHPKLTLANQLAMKELYNHHEMNSLDVWAEYFDAMAGSKFVKSMRAVGLKFALKEDTLMNTESGMYNKLDLPNG